MTPLLRAALALALGGLLIAAAPGARDPDWPCQQIKVPELSLAAIWPGSLDAVPTDWEQDPQIVGLVHDVAPRRVPIEKAQSAIRTFAGTTRDERRTKLLLLMSGLFSEMNGERNAVLAGLDRFGRRQKELAAQIRADNEKLRALQADPASDANTVEQMTRRVAWEAEVFQDRRQAVSYACDVPAKIEQRLFSLARTIQGALE